MLSMITSVQWRNYDKGSCNVEYIWVSMMTSGRILWLNVMWLQCVSHHQMSCDYLSSYWCCM